MSSEIIRPGARWAAVTLDADMTGCRALWVGVLGNVNVVGPDGVAAVFVGVQGLLPIQAKRVNTSSTTATSIVAIY